MQCYADYMVWDEDVVNDEIGSGHTEDMPVLEFMSDHDNERLDIFLTRRLPGLSRSGARRQIEKGLVQIDNEVCRPSYRLRFGDIIRVWPEQPGKPRARGQLH